MTDDEAKALALAVKLAKLFGGDLLDDGEVDDDTVSAAVDIALDAGVAALPDVVMAAGVPLPIAKLAESFLRPLIARGIAALIEAARPKRADVHAAAGSEVSMTIHDE